MFLEDSNSLIVNENSNTVKSITFVHSGEDYFFRLQRLINKAQFEIHLQTYIFENDSTGSSIADCLKKAVKRNVKVYLLLDSYGSNSLPEKFVSNLLEHGIFFRFFSYNLFSLGRRLHHKVVVADGKIALIGGVNIANKYHGTKTERPWLDYAVQVEGKIAKPLQELCRNIYFKKKRQSRKLTMTAINLNSGTIVRILRNDWLKRKNEISNAYLNRIGEAKREVIIVGCYFLPGKRIVNALKKATQKGVKIKLILAGISDVQILRRATCYLYTSLLHCNIELYEWNKSVLHGKAAIVDGEWSTIGSFNINDLSSYGSIEMNVEIVSPEFSTTVKFHLNKIIDQCQKISIDTYEISHGSFAKMINWFYYYLIRYGLIMITYLPYKRLYRRYHAE